MVPSPNSAAYLEHGSTKFWKAAIDGPTVTVAYGKIGNKGRTLKKDFDSEEDALEYFDKQVSTKRESGYNDAVDQAAVTAPPSTPIAKKRKQPPATPSSAVVKKGLAGHEAPDMEADDKTDQAIDSGVAGVDAALASRAKLSNKFHARLALVDVAKNNDKYYILQILIDEGANQKKKRTKTGRATRKAAISKQFFIFSRWGRTGTGGQAKLEGPFDKVADAEAAFCKVFKSKVGVEFAKAKPGTPPKSGKYEYLSAKPNSMSTGDKINWYYYLRYDPLGKPDGWYAYDKENSREVENLYVEYMAAGQAERLASRLIHSETSGFTYFLNLVKMTQMNTTSKKVRPIERTSGSLPTDVPLEPQDDDDDDDQPPSTPVPVASATSYKSPIVTKSSGSVPPTPSNNDVDSAASSKLQTGTIYEDYNAMLNQTNIAANNNKFYKIQLIDVPGSGIFLFTKWGRVGESGATQELGPMDSDQGTKEFEKKFKSKSGNKWDDRASFVPKKGKYTLVEMEKDDQEAGKQASNAATANGVAATPVKKNVRACTLDSTTKRLVDLIFDQDMFNSAMATLNIDPNKLPLGALSKTQIQKGFKVLESLQEVLDGDNDRSRLMDLTSEFYTVIPHAFGRSRGPVLDDETKVSQKFDMLNTLSDIEAAQEMQRLGQQEDTIDEEVDHPSDLNYHQLRTDLDLVKETEKDYELIKSYFDDTKSNQFRTMKLKDVWKVNRHNESERFEEHDDLDNRKLLWHGTNVAVVAAILKSGLRIMPHSGGRVGRGIYLADQHQKSAWYTQAAKGTTIMFLVEAALGKEHVITKDDSSLTKAPEGYDSVLAMGQTAPVGKESLEIDDKAVTIPSGAPQKIPAATGSYFQHNEYLVYKESQHRIRYVLTFQ